MTARKRAPGIPKHTGQTAATLYVVANTAGGEVLDYITGLKNRRKAQGFRLPAAEFDLAPEYAAKLARQGEIPGDLSYSLCSPEPK
jgi:hypothetical protein